MNDRLYRSRRDRVIAGVAGGVAERLNVDPALVRVVWALLVPLTGGLALLAYVVMALVVPEGDGYGAPTATPAGDPAASAGADPTTPPGQSADRRTGTGSGRVVVGVILIAIGAWYLLREFIPGLDLGRLWPVALIAVGVLLLVFSAGRWSSGRPGQGS